MKSIFLKVFILILLLLTFSFLAGCNRIENDEGFYIKGEIICEGANFKDIEIFKNNKLYSSQNFCNESGIFNINNLNKGDIISFKLDGYYFNSYTVKQSLDNVIIIGNKNIVTINVNYDDNLGAVNGDGNHFYGDDIILNAKCNDEIDFKGFYKDDTLLTEDLSYSFKADKSLVITAKFVKSKHKIDILGIPDGVDVNGAGNYSIGDTITLEACDTNCYKFLNWVVNGVNICDKVYSFVFDNVDTSISISYIKRVGTTNIVYANQSLSWTGIDNANCYKVYLNDELIKTTNETNLYLYDYIFFSGNYSISIIAIAESGYADSIKSSLNINYYRPIDTPSNIGFIYENCDVMLSFSAVNGAIDYIIKISGTDFSLSQFNYKMQSNIIKINVSDKLTENKDYLFSVIACSTNSNNNSLSTQTIVYNNLLQISPPTVEINGDILTWSHKNDDAQFNLIINDVKISLNGLTEYDLTKNTDLENYTIIVEATVTNYRGNKTIINYQKN